MARKRKSTVDKSTKSKRTAKGSTAKPNRPRKEAAHPSTDSPAEKNGKKKAGRKPGRPRKNARTRAEDPVATDISTATSLPPFEDSWGTIVRGDCIATMNDMPAGCVDLAFADPPFNIGYRYDEYDDRRDDNDYLDWSRDWMGAVKRVLKPDGAFWLAIGDEYAAELKCIATRELGFFCRNWVIWYYTFGVHCSHKFTRSHAHLLYFVKDADRFTFNSQFPLSDPERTIRVPSARQLVYADKRANPKGRVPDDTWVIAPDVPAEDASAETESHLTITPSSAPPGEFVLRPQDLPGGFQADSDTWYYARVCGTFAQRKGFHGCQMPEQVLGRIIKACTHDPFHRCDQPPAVVLDPFAGSGTTPAVAKKLSRRYVGIEMSKEYAAQCARRLAAIRPGQPLEGPVNALTSAPDTANGKQRKPKAPVAKKAEPDVLPLFGS